MTRRHHRSARRRFLGAGAVAALVAGLLVAIGAPAAADTVGQAFTRPFDSVYNATINGDIVSTGNTAVTCETGTNRWVASGTGAACADVQAGTADGQNNYFNMVYVDVDGSGDLTTFNSSSASVTIPDGATVKFAALTWAGITSAGKYTPTTGPNPGVPVLVGSAAPDASARDTVKLNVPNGSYTTITSSQTDRTGSKYQAYADVTANVVAAGSGDYTVANIQAGTGGNVYAGWSLTVVYELASLPSRNLAVYTGYGQVDPSGSDPVVFEAPLGDIVTPATGPVISRVGVVVFDGDQAVEKEALRLNSTPLANRLNPADDVFNSSATDLDVAVTDSTPSYANLFGVDIDRYQTVGALPAEATSATMYFQTTGDGFYPGVITLATDQDAPTLTAVKTVDDVNGAPLELGDVLQYSIAVTNSGTDGAVSTVLTDALPAGISYVEDSLTIESSAVTDGTGDDAGEAVGPTVTARLGTGATSGSGGSLATGVTVEVAFQATVDASITESTVLDNTATVSYNDATGGAAHTAASNTVSSSLYVPPNLTFNPTVTRGEVGLAYSKTLSFTGGTAPYTWSSTGSLPAGLTLDPATGVISGTPTAAGEASFTVTITDAVSGTDSEPATLTIVEQPVIKTGSPLTPGVVGEEFSKQLSKSGGISPYTWTIQTGTLPAGLTMDTAGLIAGTPTAAGVSTFTVKLTDGRSVVATKDFSLKILAASVTTLATSVSTVGLGGSVLLTATVTPSDATGKVNFTVVPTTGPQKGQTVQLGTNVLTGGVATKTVTLPAFGNNPVIASYEGNTGERIWGPSSSAPASVEVTATSGQLIVTQFRFSGPVGARDSFIQLRNDTDMPLPLPGFVVKTTSGETFTLDENAGTLGAGGSYLIAGEDYSLGAQAESDQVVDVIGSGGIQVLAPDTAGTQSDAVGPESGYHSGTALPAMTGTPTEQYAWVRLESAGKPVNTSDNAADFHLVSTVGGPVGGVESALGAPAPSGAASPVQHNEFLQSTLLDTAVSYRLAPNRSYTPGSPGTLVIRRTITNSSTDLVTSLRLRVTSISQVGGAPQPEVQVQPTTIAHLRVIAPAEATSTVPVSVGDPLTVHNLSPEDPGATGGGLNSTLTVPLQTALNPGDTISVAVTLAVDTTGSFWFGYNVEATTIAPG